MKKTYKNKLPKGMKPDKVTSRVENGQVIVEVELKEEFNPKDGDFIVDESGYVFVFNGKGKGLTYGCYISESITGDILLQYSDNWTWKNGCRYASEKEKSDFLKKLKSQHNMRWNPDTKEVEKIRWKPEKGEYYYYLDGMLEIRRTLNKCYLDTLMISIGNCFKTKEEAKPYAEKIKEIFRNSES